MTERKGGLLFLASGGMELSWRYAWATFVMAAIIHTPFPLPEAMGTFGLAAVLTLVAKGKGWRVIHVLAIQLIGFLLAALRTVYVFNNFSTPFLNRDWLLEFLSRPRDPLEWFLLVLVLFWTLIFWVGGITLARRSTEYIPVCSRFDLGVTAFLFLLLVRLVLEFRGGIQVQEIRSGLFLFPFFIFGLMAVGLARNQGHARKDFLSGYRKIGVILSFVVVVLLFGTGLFLLFLPYLTMAAEGGYGLLKSVAKPLTPILITVLRFLFGSRRNWQEDSTQATGQGDRGFSVSDESSGWMELLEKIMGWGFLSLIGLVVLILCGMGLWLLFRWLLSRTPADERGRNRISLIGYWLTRLKAFLLLVMEKILGGFRTPKGAVRLYASLLGWGRHSGLPYFQTETPAEYGDRLKHRFPVLKGEIEAIIGAFNLEVYGERLPSEEHLAPALLAWKRLCSPVYWPSRLKIWFFQPPSP